MKVLKWTGSKWRMASKIISLMPEHKCYIEPYFGSGAVFFKKDKDCNSEIINDLDGNVVNLFKVIRDNSKELATAIYLTPYAREEYSNVDLNASENIEKARKFLVRSNMARGGVQHYKPGWRTAGLKESINKNRRVVNEWNRLPENILAAAQRLKDAEIENIDAIKLIKKYDNEDCLIYIDPPYLLETRSNKYYSNEMTELEHIELLKTICKSKSKIILSGYDSELYKQYLKNWNKHEVESRTESKDIKTECLWLNYSI
jgi:DNA adenine methylase